MFFTSSMENRSDMLYSSEKNITRWNETIPIRHSRNKHFLNPKAHFNLSTYLSFIYRSYILLKLLHSIIVELLLYRIHILQRFHRIELRRHLHDITNGLFLQIMSKKILSILPRFFRIN